MTSFVGAVSLGVLVLQMSGLTLAMHASRQGGELYSVSAAVLLTELLKLALCLSYAAGRTGASLSVRVVCDGAQWVLSTAWPLALPSLLFVAVQQLNLFAATELDAVTFQVTNQMKLLPTAFFSVVALGRSLQLQQWLSLPVLALGVAVVNLGSAHDAHGSQAHQRAPHWFLGLSAALAAALFSGYASVFVERLLKTERLAWRDDPACCAAEEGLSSEAKHGDKPPVEAPAASSPSADCGRPLLTLNIQLAGWGALIAATQLGMMHGGRAAPRELLAHFNAFTWAVIWLQALGGLVVGLVLKYTDNIVKGFATAVSILLSCALESVLNRQLPSLAFALGLALVLLSFALFSGGEELLLQCLGPQVTGALSGAVGAWVAALARQGRQLAASSAAAAMVCASVAFVLVILSYVHLQQEGLEASGLLDARVESVHGLRAPEPPLLAASSSSNSAAAAAALPLASEPPPPLHAFSSEAGGGGLGAHNSVPLLGGITTGLAAERLQAGLLTVHAPTTAVSALYPAPAEQLELQGRDWDDDVREPERAASADEGAAAAVARTEGDDQAPALPAAQVHLGAAAAAQRAGSEAPDGSQRPERSSVARRTQPLEPFGGLGAGPAADAAPLLEHAIAGRWTNATGAEGPPGRAWALEATDQGGVM